MGLLINIKIWYFNLPALLSGKVTVVRVDATKASGEAQVLLHSFSSTRVYGGE
jgi:hypothetical protein